MADKQSKGPPMSDFCQCTSPTWSGGSYDCSLCGRPIRGEGVRLIPRLKTEHLAERDLDNCPCRFCQSDAAVRARRERDEARAEVMSLRTELEATRTQRDTNFVDLVAERSERLQANERASRATQDLGNAREALDATTRRAETAEAEVRRLTKRIWPEGA